MSRIAVSASSSRLLPRLLAGALILAAASAQADDATVAGEMRDTAVGQKVEEKVDRQTDRVQSRVESKVDQKADQAVDGVLDRMLDKLFK